MLPAVPTPGEKKALFFLSLVAALGAGVRLVGANAVQAPEASDSAALEGQIRAVDSVRRAQSGNARGSAVGRRGLGRRTRGRDRAKRSGDSSTAVEAPGSPLNPPTPPAAEPRAPVPRAPPALVDLDRASVSQLDSLAGIGPALAARIVAARDSSGPFGSLEELQSRVRGVGPAVAKRLAPNVTFSGPQRPSSAERTQPFGNGGTPARAKRRQGH
jgi:predicted flap endonuclease-1-like 5' DNA nuclease